MYRTSLRCLVGIAVAASWPGLAGAQAILGTSGDGDLAVVFPAPGSGLPTPTQINVSGLPAPPVNPHGVSYFGSDNALVADSNQSRVFNVQISTASVLATIDTSPSYNGGGTIAVAPSLGHALACGGGTATLAVIAAPFVAGAAITTVTLPGTCSNAQTQRIVFSPSGRAFVAHSTGISALDSPYSSIAFTIPLAPTTGLAITPDGTTLLATSTLNTVSVYSAPFSSLSIPSVLTIAGASSLRGIKTTPDGSRALVVDLATAIYSIAAPFGAGSTVEQIPLPASVGPFPAPGGGTTGLEDIDISADGSLAIATGNSFGLGLPAPFVVAPFTAAGATVHAVAVNGPGRGSGSVRFLPAGLAPGLSITKSAPPAVPSGGQLTYTITFGNTGPANATDVVIEEAIPSGASFLSATGGGTFGAGVVTWSLGTLGAGVTNQTVSVTVLVTAPPGATIANDNYTIEATGVAPIFGPPVETSVVAATIDPTAIPTVSELGMLALALVFAALGVFTLRRLT
jgi:uncharacterized repeat protein (TIGR01451 family)